MTEFLDIVLSFPLVLTSAVALLLAAYWALVGFGALDLEALDPTEGVLGGLGAAAEAADGIDGVEAVEAVEAVEVASTPLAVLAGLFRLGRVPASIALTAFVAWAWLLGFLLTWALRGMLGGWGLALLVCVVGYAAAVALTNLSVRPLEGMFTLHPARERASLIGEVCTLSTGRVDERFGQATAQLGSDDLLFQVRCDGPNTLRRGDLALIVSFDTQREAYVIEPLAGLRKPNPQGSAEADGGLHPSTARLAPSVQEVLRP